MFVENRNSQKYYCQQPFGKIAKFSGITVPQKNKLLTRQLSRYAFLQPRQASERCASVYNQMYSDNIKVEKQLR